MAYPHQPGLIIAMPLTGQPVPPQVMFCYAQLAPPMNYNVQYIHTGAKLSEVMPVADARNFFAEHAVSVNAKYLFMIGQDVAVPAHALRQLIFYLDHHDDWAVIGGIYCQKGEGITAAPMVFRGNGKGPYWDWRAGEVFECSGLGADCMLVRVAALKDIPRPWFSTVDDNSETLDAINRGTAWTEDLWFCNQIAKTGKWKVYADGGILPDHLDMKTGRAFNLPPESKPYRHLVVPKGEKKILEIGSGQFPMKTDEGLVTTFDARDEPENDIHPDYRGDARRLPFGDGQFDIVYSGHCLEHFGRNEIHDVLTEWRRVLKPEGEMRMVLPNIEWAAQAIVEGVVDDTVLNVLYGAQTYKENYHYMGFTPATIESFLAKVGLDEFLVQREGFEMILQAKKRGAAPMQKVTRKIYDGHSSAITATKPEGVAPVPVGKKRIRNRAK